MSEQLLESRWGETKEALLEGLNGSKRNSMSVILENTRKYLKENASSGSTGSDNIATLNRVDRKSTRLNSSHIPLSRMPSSA